MNQPVLQLGAAFAATLWIGFGCSEKQPSGSPPVDGTAAANAGPRIVYASDRKGSFDIYSVNPDGSGARNLTRTSSSELYPALSPDGTEVAYAAKRIRIEDIWVMTIDGGTRRQLTDDDENNSWPAWSPDGRRIAFVSTRNSTVGWPQKMYLGELFVMDADGTNVEQVTHLDSEIMHPSWSPDGQRIVFDCEKDHENRRGARDIYTVRVDGSDLVNLSETIISDGYQGHGRFPAYSPDGADIVFIAVNRGTSVCVMSAAGGGFRTLTNDRRQEAHPAWSPDGARIVYAIGDRGSFDLYVMNADGTNRRRIVDSRYEETLPDW